MENLELNKAGCAFGKPTKIEEVKRIVEELNSFYEDHGRMPSSREIGLLDDDREHTKTKELVYEPIDGE